MKPQPLPLPFFSIPSIAINKSSRTKYIHGKLMKSYDPNYRQRCSELLHKPAEVGNALMSYWYTCTRIYLNKVWPSSTRYTLWLVSLFYSYSYFVGIFYSSLPHCPACSSFSPLDEMECIFYMSILYWRNCNTQLAFITHCNSRNAIPFTACVMYNAFYIQLIAFHTSHLYFGSCFGSVNRFLNILFISFGFYVTKNKLT
jgi:hypothetical protein